MAKSNAKAAAGASKSSRETTKAKSTSKGVSKTNATATTKKKRSAKNNDASHLIDERIQSPGDWRAETLAEVRRLIHDADPEISEENKWAKSTNPSGVPVWSHAGIVCTGETYRQVVKLTFLRGASLQVPHGLFNSSLEGNTRRAIDIREGEKLNAKAFKALIQAAVAENLRSSSTKTKSTPNASAKSKAVVKQAKPMKGQKDANAGVVLLSGGNPQIPKGDGDAPVQAYIAAMPGWKRDLGKRLDAIVVRTVPNVRKAVKWNSPFYGTEGQGWFLSFHVFTRYVKATFFNGTSLHPVPPGGTPKSKEVRWIDIYEEDELDEAQLATWVKQAASLPGWIL